MMIEKLKILLQSLNDSLNLESQLQSASVFKDALTWKQINQIPLIVTFPYPSSQPVLPFPHHEIFANPEKMLFNELVYAFDTSIWLHREIGDDLPFTIRANFGTVIIASLFGGKVEQRGENPPWVRHFETKKDFKSIFDRDPLDFSHGFCPQVISRYEFYRDVLNEFPNLQKCIKVVLPDLQGPLDTLELLRGSSVYEDFIMEPESVDEGLQLMAKAQVGFAKYLQQFTTDNKDGYTHQHATCIKGNILIRNDSAIMISPEMYSVQVAPHDEYVLKEMGGGGIHSCGKIDFNIPEILKLPSIQCFDYGQSHLNDLDFVYSLAKEKKIPLIRIRVEKDELMSEEIKERFPTGVSLVYNANSFEEAKELVKNYRNGT